MKDFDVCLSPDRFSATNVAPSAAFARLSELSGIMAV